MSGWNRISAEKFGEQLKEPARSRYLAAVERVAAKRATGIGVDMRDPNDPCPAGCHGAGVVYAHAWDASEGSPSPLIACPRCKSGEMMAARAQANLVGGSGMSDMDHVTFTSTMPSLLQQSLWDQASDWLDMVHGDRPWLWLEGEPSVGKTRLAYCVGNAWMSNGVKVVFRVERDMMSALRSTFDRDSRDNYDEQIRLIREAPLLILDDFGREQTTEWVQLTRFSIANYRLERNMPTVVTTNWRFAQLEQHDQRLARHLKASQRCLVLKFPDQEWKSPKT